MHARYAVHARTFFPQRFVSVENKGSNFQLPKLKVASSSLVARSKVIQQFFTEFPKKAHAQSGTLPKEALTHPNVLEMHEVVQDSRRSDLTPEPRACRFTIFFSPRCETRPQTAITLSPRFWQVLQRSRSTSVTAIEFLRLHN